MTSAARVIRSSLVNKLTCVSALSAREASKACFFFHSAVSCCAAVDEEEEVGEGIDEDERSSAPGG